MEVNVAALQSAGWLSGTEVALKTVMVTNLAASKEHNDDGRKLQNAVNATAPDLNGIYMSWVNYLECNNNKVNIISSALQVDNSQIESEDSSGSTAHVVAFAFINLNQQSGSACIWDPVVGVNRVASDSTSLVASFALIATAVFCSLF